jgi:hypothetical protein
VPTLKLRSFHCVETGAPLQAARGRKSAKKNIRRGENL